MKSDTREKLRAGYIFILVFVILAAGIITIGYLGYRNYERRFRIETENQLSAIAELKVSELARWRKERLGDAGILFKNASFSAFVRNFFRRPADSESRGQLQVWLDNYRTHYEYDRIFLLDAQCVERISAPETPEPVAAHLLEQAPEILRSDRVTFLDFHRDSPDRPIHLSILIPILDEGDNRPALGILVLRIDPGRYLYPYINRWPTPSRSAETLLIRRDGNDALFLNELRFQKNTALNLRFPLTATEFPAVKAALGREGIVEGVDYRGNRVAACVLAVPDSPWFLVARMDTAEVYAPARERLWVTIALVGALLLGAGAGVGLIWRQQRVRFYRERHRTAEALRENEERFRQVVETIREVFWLRDRNTGRILYISPAYETIWGRTVEEMYLKGPSFMENVHPEDKERVSISHKALYEENRPFEEEYRIFRPDRSIRWVRARTYPVFDRSGSVTRHVGIAEDITGRKRAEDALRRSEIRLKGILEATADGILAVDHQGKVISVNRRFAEMWRIPPKLVERGDDDALLAYVFDQLADPEAFMAKVRELYGSDKEETSVILFKDDRVFERFSSPLILKSSIVGRIWSFRDITGRKRAEDALRQTEENFRRSLDDSPLGVRIVNAEGETLYANRAILDIYGYDSIEELRATPLGDRYTPESYDEFQLRKEKRRQGEDGPSEYQISIVKKNGEIRRVQVFRKEVFWNGTRRFQTLYHDITEQKRAEEAVQAALREKEVLLREIHHRVKNNMQVISSLFNLQAGHIKDEEARRILKEGQTRIRSMGLIHEKLYQSRDLSKIDFSAYIRSLLVHLFHAYRIDANQVRLETELEDVHLDINAAVPCGLLVNELISNALKHAFPEGRKGAVKIGLRRRDDGAVELRVADNGVGFPEKLDFRRTESLGLQIVNLLIGQLDGTIELERKRGTAIVIAFQESGRKPKTA